MTCFSASQRYEYLRFSRIIGSRIQKITKSLSERWTSVEGADICKELGGLRHYIQIKAGPNTVNKDISSEINRLLRSAIRSNHGSVALLGMTYGERGRVSSIIRRYSDVDWLIGVVALPVRSHCIIHPI